MKSTIEILESYLQGVRLLTEADSVGLYIPAAEEGELEPILLHLGDEIVSELRSLDAARESIDPFSSDGNSLSFARASADAGGWLVPLSPQEPPLEEDGERTRRAADIGPDRRPRGWLGLRLPPSAPQPPSGLEDMTKLWRYLTDLGAGLADQALQLHTALRDPVTGLADRIGFQAMLADQIERARERRAWLSLALLNPHNFGQVNERFGRFAGDRVMQELAELVCETLRDSDPVSRYGGAIFAALLPAADADSAELVAQKLVKKVHQASFLKGDVRLELCCGIATIDPSAEAMVDPLDLLRRADTALNLARRTGGGTVEVWQKRTGADTRHATPISELFSGDLARDYRNMALLRDAVELVADTHDLDTLAGSILERVYSACKAERVGLFRRQPSGEPELVRGIARPPSPVGARRVSFDLEAEPLALLAQAMKAGDLASGVVSGLESRRQLAFAVPIVASGRSLGALYVDGAVESIDIDTTDLIFLKALASQLSIALERSHLSQLEHHRGTVELEAELLELRSAVREHRPVFVSSAMVELMANIARVGPTEATILITGESGTGKELIARELLRQSPRRRKGLTVVDCAAIAPTLIDSELFGHDRGAYTGAGRRRSGRLAEADGGTILLDEIGELPLEVQSRLLRFVQEKQITLVGESKPRPVDVRILAATNRDLENEARAGRFREDLFHRLNVVRLDVPPLRERPEDVAHLAEHFVSQFSEQYGKVGAHLDSSALEALVRYDWPGNVRELQNRILQAVILLEDREIGAGKLGLPDAPSDPVRARRRRPLKGGVGISVADASEQLGSALQDQIQRILTDELTTKLPIGKWIAEDLLIEADLAEGRVARRAAQRVGLAETTYRRRLQQAVERQRAGLAPRPDGWAATQGALTSLLHAHDLNGQPLLEVAERALLEEIVALLPDDEPLGAALLGVTVPTYRRRLEKLRG